jgi:hypothetical protein
LLGTNLARRTAEVMFRASGRLHLARLDQRSQARCQARILLGLVNQAQPTPFGRGHDFRRIRTVLDYRRLVPVQDAPHGTCLAAALHASHRAGLRTALTLAAGACPKANLFAGSFLFLHEEGEAGRVPGPVRSYSLTAGAADLAALARRCAAEPVTCLAGPAGRLVSLLEQLRALTGKGVGDVWPGLAAVLYSSDSAAAVEALRPALGPGARMLEAVWGPQGMLAVEDPRHGRLRLLYDHGLFFEFLPLPSLALQAGGGAAPRWGLDEVEVGTPCELVLTSPAGSWSCRTGRVVCLERRDLALVRFLDVPVPAAAEAAPARADKAVTLPLPLPVPGPHRQGAGTSAALPGSFVHSPWSALAGRG